MGGFDDHGSIMGDWVLPSSSPRFFFSGALGDDVNLRSTSEPKGENRGKFAFPAPEGQSRLETANDFDRQLADISAINQATDKSGPFSEQKLNSGKGLSARIAARGFNAPRLNTEGIRPASISQNPEVRSPYLTIPPGLSPTTLLDSPVFLSNSLVQPSPTTGKFQFAANGNGKSSMMFSESSDKNKDYFFEGISTASFAFKPVADSAPNSRSTISKVTPSVLARHPFPSIEVSVQADDSFPPQSIETVKLHSHSGPAHHLQSDFSRTAPEKNAEANNVSSGDRQFGAVARSAENSPPLDEQQDEDADQRFSGDTNVNNGPAEDGYNWRKYGQKQVKGSEYPRSYYKCTHPNCPVKKKVERSHEGHITEIIYKGAHSHPKPPSNRRSVLGSSNALCEMQVDVTEQGGPAVVDGDPGWMQKGTTDWRHDNLEVTSSAQLGQLQTQNSSQFEPTDPVDVSSTFSNDEEEDDRGTHGSVSLGYDGEGDESESKRRKVEAYAADVSGATRAIREPRVVVQTTSEVDVLDDGYRWRKYGQKVVKGNPNPRSYYKCTSAGCTVRKHVERASHDLKSVITTYEGKHNHDVPAARNSSHMNSSVSNTMSSQGQGGQTQAHRPESSHQLQNSMARFERPHSLGSFGLAGRQQLGPPHGFGFGINQPGLSNLAMAGLGPNQGKMPALPVHQYLGQQCQMNEMGFMLPKGEPKVEPMSETGLNPSSGAAVYHQMMMNRLPLGPHM